MPEQNWEEIRKKLFLKFKPDELEWRIQSSGVRNNKPWARILCYVTNRAIQKRLDMTFGQNGWRNEFVELKAGGFICGISAWDESKQKWITKWDGAPETDIESLKGGLSNAMKRAGSQWGIGRYLYKLGDTWAQFSPRGRYSAKIQGEYYKWDPEELPSNMLPPPQEGE